MTIYTILTLKEHNQHHLLRYIKFIEHYQISNINIKGNVEKHHICPKAADMFPEYKSFSLHPWNCVVLTPRQHFIAHLMLWKAFPTTRSQVYALGRMKHSAGIKNTSKLYEAYRLDFSKKRSAEVLERPFHHMKAPNNPAALAVEKGTHHFLDSEVQSKINYKKVINGTHPFLDKVKAKERADKRIENGTHHFLNEDFKINLGKRNSHLLRTKPSMICPHCLKEGRAPSVYRWHFDNCDQMFSLSSFELLKI